MNIIGKCAGLTNSIAALTSFMFEGIPVMSLKVTVMTPSENETSTPPLVQLFTTSRISAASALPDPRILDLITALRSSKVFVGSVTIPFSFS
ncbi:hypothetical protein D3C84_1123400 [compost metagenome]